MSRSMPYLICQTAAFGHPGSPGGASPGILLVPPAASCLLASAPGAPASCLTTLLFRSQLAPLPGSQRTGRHSRPPPAARPAPCRRYARCAHPAHACIQWNSRIVGDKLQRCAHLQSAVATAGLLHMRMLWCFKGSAKLKVQLLACMMCTLSGRSMSSRRCMKG